MPISVACPGCSTKFKAPDAAAGKRIKCPKCGGAIAVTPGAATTATASTATNSATAPPAAKPAQPAVSAAAPRPVAAAAKAAPPASPAKPAVAPAAKAPPAPARPVPASTTPAAKAYEPYSSGKGPTSIIDPVTLPISLTTDADAGTGLKGRLSIVAGVLSILPGLGHMYRRRPISAVCWFVAVMFGWLMGSLIPFGFVIGILVWVLCFVSALLGIG
jgi:hypothetical protein